MKTLPEYFVEACGTRLDEAMFRHSHGALSYRDVARTVATDLDRLRRLGIEPGARALAVTDETIPLAHLLLTAGLARIVPAAISPVFSPAYLGAMCERLEVSAIFTTPELVPLVETFAGKVPVLQYTGARAKARPALCSANAGVWGAAEPSLDLDEARTMIEKASRALALDDTFLIQPTSGSTGAPKLVVRKHAACSRYAHFIASELEALPGEGRRRMLAVNALTHAFACHMFTLAMKLGAEILVPEHIDAEASLAEVRALDPELLPMTPRVLRSFMRQQTRFEAPERPLFGAAARLLLSAGGKGDPASLHRLRSEGVEVVEFYGSSEASVIAVTPLGGWREGLAGVPVADVEIEAAPSGELLVRSPGLMAGYYGEDESAFDANGFYPTGDLGAVDACGYLEILGRRRDLFSTPEGTNIYPECIETILEGQDWIEQVILVGDGRPFISAHIVVDHELLGILPSGRRRRSPSGLVHAEESFDAYEHAGRLLFQLNQRLELIEQVVAFALYDRTFDHECYSVVAAGKVRRDRPAFAKVYSAELALLYSDLDKDSPAFVPPRERRYRARARRREVTTSGLIAVSNVDSVAAVRRASR